MRDTAQGKALGFLPSKVLFWWILGNKKSSWTSVKYYREMRLWHTSHLFQTLRNERLNIRRENSQELSWSTIKHFHGPKMKQKYKIVGSKPHHKASSGSRTLVPTGKRKQRYAKKGKPEPGLGQGHSILLKQYWKTYYQLLPGGYRLWQSEIQGGRKRERQS